MLQGRKVSDFHRAQSLRKITRPSKTNVPLKILHVGTSGTSYASDASARAGILSAQRAGAHHRTDYIAG